MNGAAAFPTQYALSMIAFVVIFFVCPAVTDESQLRLSTKLVVPTPAFPGVLSTRSHAPARRTHPSATD
jgi:hypothetical protein